MPSDPGAFPSFSLLIEVRISSVVKSGVQPSTRGRLVTSDRSQGILGPPVAGTSKSACLLGSLVSWPSGLQSGGKVLDAGRLLVYRAAVNRSLAESWDR